MLRISGLLLCLGLARLADGRLVSSHVFSNHKGGCGKTTILFHTSCEYASRHPDEKVLVIDSTLRGDLSEIFLGGNLDAAGKRAVKAVGHIRSTTKLLMQAAAVHAAQEVGPGHSALNSAVSKLLESTEAPSSKLDLDSHVVQASEFNDKIPKNLYLCPGGTGPQAAFPAPQRQPIVDTLRAALENHADKWKVLMDTDGDQGFSDYTKIAHALCDQCVVPLKTNVNDFANRCVPMMEELFLQRSQGEARARVQLIVWNEVDVYKNVPSEVSHLITPPKATQSVINMLNGLVLELASMYPDLFYNAPPADRVESQDFSDATTMCTRSFGITGLAAAEHGIPFCSMKAGNLEGGRLTYEIQGETLKSLCANIAELSDRLNDPPWGKY